MQEHDARVLRGAAIPTAVVGALAMAVAFALRGTDALIGSALGTLLTIAFFAVSYIAVARAGERSPTLMFPVAMGTYLLKVVVLGALLLLFRGTDAFDAMALALTTVACVVVWLAAQMRGLATSRRPIVEPVGGASAGPTEADHSEERP